MSIKAVQPSLSIHYVCHPYVFSISCIHSTDPYSLQASQNQDNAELFVNCLEAMVETCLPGDDLGVNNHYPSPLGISSNLNLSSSMSSLSICSLHSPTTDRDSVDAVLANFGSSAAGSNPSGMGGGRTRHGSATNHHGAPSGCKTSGASRAYRNQ